MRPKRNKFGMLDKKAMLEEAQNTCRELGIELPLTTEAGLCSVGHQQMTEILRILMLDAKVVIMDEPTAALTERETATLFKMMRKMKARGVAIVYISHRMEEVFSECDTITVMRDGHTIITKPTAEISVDEVVRHMVGRSIDEFYPARTTTPGEVVMSVDNLKPEGFDNEISFSLRKGEILGVAGLMGAGRTEIMRAIFGVDKHNGGTVTVNGSVLNCKKPEDAIKAGIAFITENRKSEGLILDFSIGSNITLPNLGEICPSHVLDKGKLNSFADELSKKLGVKTQSIHEPASSLSGGNQQKVVIAKWVGKRLTWLHYINPLRYIKRLDWYIIKKFIGTYIYSIALIISISIVIDINENLAKFSEYHAPLKAIVFDYYMNFIPYFANLFSPLFVFIAVIFFTSKLAGNSEIIAMLAAGVSFKRLMRPYMISCILISVVSFYLSGYVIPHSNVIRQNFESLYKNKKKTTAADNVMLNVGKGTIAYIQHYDNNTKRGYGFSLDKFQDKKLVSHMTAMEIQYDTISDSKYHWTAQNYKIRKFNGYREQIENGAKRDTTILMEPNDLVYSKGQQETFTNPELSDYISKQIDRGSSNVVQYQVEYHKRIAASFASFILTIIGLSLSAKKRKGGMGMYLGIGLALSFGYIMLQTVSSTFAINANLPPIIAAWIPNIIFAIVAYFCYKQAPN